MNLNLNAPINNTTGYGLTSTNILKALHKDPNITVKLFGIGNTAVEANNETMVKGVLEDTMKTWSSKDPCLKIWHQWDLASRIGNGKYGALIFFEIDLMALCS